MTNMHEVRLQDSRLFVETHQQAVKITKFHFVILGGVSANEVNFFAFGLHENSGFKFLRNTKTRKILNPNDNLNFFFEHRIHGRTLI